MTIEQRALKLWGPARDPGSAIWILADGTLINGCMGSGVRDVDHAEIGQFFKPSKFQDPGSNWIYIKKFIRRGNVRMSFSQCEAFFEFAKTPSPAQWQAMGRCFVAARREGLPVRLERMGRVPGTGKCYTVQEYVRHLARYAPDRVA